MTKAEAITQTTAMTRLDKKQTEVIITAFTVGIMDALAECDSIFILGFGTFYSKWRNETTGRDIKRNKAVIVPPHYLPFFKPHQDFKNMVKI